MKSIYNIILNIECHKYLIIMAKEHSKNARPSTSDKHTNRSKPVAEQKKTKSGNYKPNNGKRR